MVNEGSKQPVRSRQLLVTLKWIVFSKLGGVTAEHAKTGGCDDDDRRSRLHWRT